MDSKMGTSIDQAVISGTEPPTDTQALRIAILTAGGGPFAGSGRMVWY